MVKQQKEAEREQTSEYLTLQEVAQRLRVNPRTVQRWIHSGKLKAYRAGHLWRIRPEDLDDFLEG